MSYCNKELVCERVASAGPTLPPLPALLAPPPPTTTTAGQPPVRMTPPTFSAPPPFNTPTMFLVTQPPLPLPPMFDASRPPPPFPTNATPKRNGAVKRAAGPSEAGPSKVRKAECSKVVETVCENCIQRELRSELYNQELQKLERMSEYQSYIYETKCAENANGRRLLKSTVSSELFRMLDEYTEEPSQQVQFQDLLDQFNQTPLFDTTPVPIVGMDESSMLHSLTSRTWIANPISLTSSYEVVRNNSSDRNKGNESRTKEASHSNRGIQSTSNISSNAVNGFGHFAKGHKVVSAPPAAVASSSRYPATTNIAARTYSSATASTASLTQSAAHTSTALHLPNASHHPGVARPPTAAHPPRVPHPANATHPLSVWAVSAPAAYLSYQPAVPPPAGRGYYSQPYLSTANHVPNVHQSYPNSPARMAVTTQVPSRPSTSAPAPPVQNAQNYNMYAMGRYPQPHNYPPFP